MARHGPEDKGEGGDKDGGEDGDPDRAPEEELLDVRLADAERAASTTNATGRRVGRAAQDR